MHQSIHNIKAISVGKVRPLFHTDGSPYVTRQIHIITPDFRLTFDVYGTIASDISLLSYDQEFPTAWLDTTTGEVIRPDKTLIKHGI